MQLEEIIVLKRVSPEWALSFSRSKHFILWKGDYQL